MAWTATIEKVIREGDVLVVPVTYTDGQVKKSEDNRLTGGTLAGFKAHVQAKLDSLNSVDTLATAIVPGPFDPKPIPPIAEELARIAYVADLRLFGQIIRAIAAEVKTTVDQDYIDVKKRVHDNFIDSYIDLF